MDMKYVIGVLLLAIATVLFFTGKIDQNAFFAMIAIALAVMGYSYVKTVLSKK